MRARPPVIADRQRHGHRQRGSGSRCRHRRRTRRSVCLARAGRRRTRDGVGPGRGCEDRRRARAGSPATPVCSRKRSRSPRPRTESREPQLIGGRILNRWQDADHVRGIWRRTSLADYRKSAPAWTTVLDLDALAVAEKANWFWSGARLRGAGGAPLHDRLVGRRRGRGYAARVRFALGAICRRRFFASPRQAGLGLAGRRYAAGRPRMVARRAHALRLSVRRQAHQARAAAVGGRRGVSRNDQRRRRQSVGVQRRRRPPGARYPRARCRFSKPNTNSSRSNGTRKLALPAKADIVALVAGRLVVSLREDWTTDGGATFPQGSLVSIDLAAASAAPDQLRPTLIYAPGPREAFEQAAATRGHLLVSVLDNVKGRAYVYTPEPAGKWSRRRLALPDNVSIHIVDTDLHSDRAFLSVTGFLTPTSLWLADLATGALATVKTLPPRFDASHHVVEQFEATSSDGTRVPYFVVHRDRHEARRQHADDPHRLRRLPGFRDAVLFAANRQAVAGARRRVGARQHPRRRRIRARLARGRPQDAAPAHLRRLHRRRARPDREGHHQSAPISASRAAPTAGC